MNTPNPLAKLALDHWYKAIMAVCAFVFILSGMGMLKEFPTGTTAAFSAGGFFIGMGEWINHPLHTDIQPATAYYPAMEKSWIQRANKPIGIAFIVLGAALICLGAYMLT